MTSEDGQMVSKMDCAGLLGVKNFLYQCRMKSFWTLLGKSSNILVQIKKSSREPVSKLQHLVLITNHNQPTNLCHATIVTHSIQIFEFKFKSTVVSFDEFFLPV